MARHGADLQAYFPDGSGRDLFVMHAENRTHGKVAHMNASDSIKFTPRSPRAGMSNASLLRASGIESLKTTSDWALNRGATWTVVGHSSAGPNPWSWNTYRSTYAQGFNFNIDDYGARFEDANGVRTTLHANPRRRTSSKSAKEQMLSSRAFENQATSCE
mmetsp:Transcript_35087/g.54481  ORF Transcript_35087/g.54481 Transcript_35087/m.54481 type:complete len:160 (+) Transcript_35087:88-567(+)